MKTSAGNGEAALHDLQVVELASGIAGPIVGQLLADFGAEVAKIEAVGGDPSRADPGFAAWNRGKKSVVVEANDMREATWLQDLIAGADLLIGTRAEAARLGLDLVELMAAHPRLVVADVSPYLDPAPWAGGQESNGLLSASLGVASRQSSWDGGPVETVAPELLYGQAAWAAACCVAALVERQRSGFGQLVTVTGVHGTLLATVATLSIDPAAADPATDVGPAGRHPTYTRFQTAEGAWLASGALGAKFERKLLGVLGMSDILDDERLGGETESMILPDNVDWVMERVATAFKERPREEWLALLEKAGIPCGPVADRADLLDHPQVVANGLRVTVDDPARGPVVMAGPPLVLSATPAQVRVAAPRLNEHAGKLRPRARVPVSVEEHRRPMAVGPLAGVRVLDLGTFVAGPYAGALLAELGADVVKVEQTTGEPFRGLVFNRGMRSLAVNLKEPAGLEAFFEVADNCDLVVTSLRPGATKVLGIDHESLSARNPRIISVALSAYGEKGPMASTPGVDIVVQAMSGMMRAQGGGDEPAVNTVPMIDVTTAALMALGACLALYERHNSSCGQRVAASLLATATYLQSGELVRCAGRPAPAVGYRDYRGSGPFRRFMRAQDGWIRIDTMGRESEPDRTALLREGLIDDPGLSDERLAGAVEAAVAGMSAREAIRRFEAIQIAATRSRRPTEVVRDPRLVMADVFHVRQQGDDPLFVTTGRYASFSRTPRSGPLVTSGVGEHSVAVLREVGQVPLERIESLLDRGIAVAGPAIEQRLPPPYR